MDQLSRRDVATSRPSPSWVGGHVLLMRCPHELRPLVGVEKDRSIRRSHDVELKRIFPCSDTCDTEPAKPVETQGLGKDDLRACASAPSSIPLLDAIEWPTSGHPKSRDLSPSMLMGLQRYTPRTEPSVSQAHGTDAHENAYASMEREARTFLWSAQIERQREVGSVPAVAAGMNIGPGVWPNERKRESRRPSASFALIGIVVQLRPPGLET